MDPFFHLVQRRVEAAALLEQRGANAGLLEYVDAVQARLAREP